MTAPFKHGSLFSGIGGFDIAASWMGWQNVFSSEKNPFCGRILKHYWPNTHHYEDIYQFSAAQYRGCVDLISGGFPCQPFSQAGKRQGKADDRYLFPEACRVITEARPRWIVLENVAGLFSILEPDTLSQMEIQAVELFCEDCDQQPDTTIIRLQRRVIASIISEIRAAGYVLPTLKDGTPVVLCIPAAGTGAPHQRDRVWFVAHANSDRDQQYGHYGESGTGRPPAEPAQEGQRQFGTGFLDGFSDVSGINGSIRSGDTDLNRYASFHAQPLAGQPAGGQDKPQNWQTTIPGWETWPAQPAFCGRNDGLPRELDGIAFSRWRKDSVKAYGNAIVPQVALQIFRAIELIERFPHLYRL